MDIVNLVRGAAAVLAVIVLAVIVTRRKRTLYDLEPPLKRVSVSNLDQTQSLGTAIEVADSSFQRMKGLLGRKGLAAGGGLWIRPSSGVHTLFMSFPIDVVGLDKQYRVVHLWPGLKPWRITRVSVAVRTVLELPAGTISNAGLTVGTQLGIRPVEQTSEAAPQLRGRANMPGPDDRK